MEPRPNFFPVYVSGQYLTSENLNETQNFLWQEEKASRYLLAGNGIAQGLTLSFTDSTLLRLLTISAGDASTIDGYIIQLTTAQSFDKGCFIDLSGIALQDGSQQLMEKATYDKVKENMNATEFPLLNSIELFNVSGSINNLPVGTQALDGFAIASADAIANYIVLAWVFINDEENDNCVQGDCNTKGILRNYITRYFLVKSDQFAQENSLNPAMPLSMAARIKNISSSGSATGFYQIALTAWNANITQLQPYFSSANSGKQLGLIAALLDATEQTALANAITKFSQIAVSSNANCQQYNNAFASDLSLAINELVESYNDFAIKYAVYSSERIEGVIMLGSFAQAAIDKWRYYFLPATQQAEYVFERNRLKQLFMRAVSLVNNFIMQANIKTQAAKIAKVIATPSIIGNNTLANKAIPYYYDVLSNGDVLQNWNPRSSNPLNVFCYYDTLIASRSSMVAKLSVADWMNENFFRIEGHVGMLKQDAVSAITALIVNDGLPFQLLDCDVDYQGPVTWYNWYQQFSSFLNNSLTLLRSNPNITNYAYDPFKKITTVNLETSYRQPDAVKSILDNLTAYSGVFYNAAKVQGFSAKSALKQPVVSKKAAAKKIVQKLAARPQVTTAKTLAAGISATSPLSQEVINHYMTVVPQETITNLVSGYNSAITDVTNPQTKKLIVLKDLAGLEYLGGVPRGGAFVLLHSGGTVIGDGCLSYYYRIDQNRIFDI